MKVLKALQAVGLTLALLVGGLTASAIGDGQIIVSPPAGAAGAPTTATYITQTADATLSAEQNLDALASGILRVDTAAGVLTSLTDSAGIFANISDETGGTLLVGSAAPVFTTSIGLEAAGVLFTAANGGLTTAGLGDGTDENLTLNLNASNEATYTSSTGVATFNFTAADARITAEESVTTFVVLAADPNSNDGVSGIYWDDGDDFELGVLTSPTDGTTNPLYTIEFATGNLRMESLGGTFVVGGAGFIDYGTNGVRLSADLDGAYVWLGLGNGFDESITWNLDDVENTVGVSSTTAVDTFNFESIGLQESGNAVPNATDHLGFFAATTSAQFFGVIDDETGGTLVVGSDSPVFTTHVDLEAAGVRLSAANGVLTILGTGDGVDEDLVFDLNAAAGRVHITGASIWQFNQGQTLLSTASLALDASGNVTVRGSEWVFNADDFRPGTADAGNDIGTLAIPVDRLYVLHRINASGISASESYKVGLGASLDPGDVAHDVLLAAGQAQSFDTSQSIILAAEITKRLDAPWAVGDDAGGLGEEDAGPAATLTFSRTATPDTISSDDTTFADCNALTTETGVILIDEGSTNDGIYEVASCTDSVLTLGNDVLVGDETSTAGEYTVRYIWPNTWYHFILIENAGTEDACFDRAESGATCLSESAYDERRFMQSFLTDANANLLGS